MQQKLVGIIGVTASGKTALGEALALRFDGEIISCDAKQVYMGMNIGTAKELDLRVPQHLLDFKQPGEVVRVAEYQALAYAAIDEVLARGKRAFLVGGSMLYAESVLAGYQFQAGKKSAERVPRYQTLILGTKIEREAARAKARARTRLWLDHGLLDEIRTLLSQGVSPDWLKHCGMEYCYFTAHLQGELSLDEALHKADTAVGQYIKRQEIWWRRRTDIHWVANADEAALVLEHFYADVLY